MRPLAPSRGSVHPSPDGVLPRPRPGSALSDGTLKPRGVNVFRGANADQAWFPGHGWVCLADTLSPARRTLARPAPAACAPRAAQQRALAPRPGAPPSFSAACAGGAGSASRCPSQGASHTQARGKKLSVSREDAHIRRNPLGDAVRVSAITFVCSHSRGKQQCTWP